MSVVATLAIGITGACGDEKQRFEMIFDPCVPVVLLPEEAAPDEHDSIERAIEMWSGVADLQITLDPNAEGRPLPIRFENVKWYMGRFDDTEGAIWLSRRVNDTSARAVILAHELGHAFGLYHVEPSERVSVMNKGNISIAPTAEDAAELEHLWGGCTAKWD